MAQVQVEAYTKAAQAADKGTALRAVEFTEEERKAIDELNLITMKPVLFVANVGESELPDDGRR